MKIGLNLSYRSQENVHQIWSQLTDSWQGTRPFQTLSLRVYNLIIPKQKGSLGANLLSSPEYPLTFFFKYELS